MNNRTQAFDSLKMTQELIRFIDTKANILLVVYGILITTFFKLSEKMNFVNPLTIHPLSSKILSIINFTIGTLFWITIFYQLHQIIYGVIIPRYAKNYSEGDSSSFYFAHIACIEKTKFISNFLALDENAMLNEILDQLFEVSCILSTKTKHLTKAVKTLYSSIVFLVIFWATSSLS
jgi:hypothetical protein